MCPLADLPDLPLPPDTRAHLFPGVTVLIAPEATPVPRRCTLAEAILSDEFWTADEMRDPLHSDRFYCLVSRTGFRLHQSDEGHPMRYREHLAITAGIPLRRLALFPAAPRVSDAAIDGWPCITVLAVADRETAHGLDQDNFFSFLVDGRPLGQGWLCFQAFASPILAAEVLDTLNAAAPLGKKVEVEGAHLGPELLHIAPGTVLHAAYVDDGEQLAPALSPAHDGDSDSSGRSGFPCCFTEVQVLAPDFASSRVPLQLPMPVTASQLRGAVAAESSDHLRSTFPRLIEVFPQPSTFCCYFLRRPAWPYPGTLVCVDARRVAGGLFACRTTPNLSRSDCLAMIGRQDVADVSIYVRDTEHPWMPEECPNMLEGDLIRLFPQSCPFSAAMSLEDVVTCASDWEMPVSDVDEPWDHIWMVSSAHPEGGACPRRQPSDSSCYAARGRHKCWHHSI